jgi:hypothetical protein
MDSRVQFNAFSQEVFASIISDPESGNSILQKRMLPRRRGRGGLCAAIFIACQALILPLRQGNPLWDAAEVDTFRVIFEISPDMTPCDLAKLCLKPCREVIFSLGVFARLLKEDQVLYHRKLLYPDNPGEVQLVDVKGKRRTLKFKGRFQIFI